MSAGDSPVQESLRFYEEPSSDGFLLYSF